MIKKIRRALLKKFYGDTYPMLDDKLREIFKKGNYIQAAILSLYLLPVRKIFLTQTHKNTFTTSKKYYEELQNLLRISKVNGFDLVRIGKENDGGYISLNDFHEGGIAYSFGLGENVSWDKDMASRGYDVFMYDHTIEKLPEENSRFHFFQQGIADGKTQDEKLKTLDELIKQNHHEDKRDMILKMDVEGAEWGFLENVSSETLSQFGQMVFEFHNMICPNDPERIINVLKKINKTHKLIHVHANNAGSFIEIGGKNFASLFEVSYVLRDKYNFVDDYDVNLPLEIDSPNIKGIPEINLGHWNRPAEIGEKITSIINTL